MAITKLMIGCNGKQLGKVISILALDFGMTQSVMKHNTNYPHYMRPAIEFNLEFLNFQNDRFRDIKDRFKNFKNISIWTKTEL